MILESIPVGLMQVNAYILASGEGKEALIIDPGDEANKIKRALDKHRLKPLFIVNTHGHYDHIGADDEFGVSVYIHRQDVVLLQDPRLNLSALFSFGYRVKSKIMPLKDKDKIELEGMELEVIHVPGHTAGGIALYLKKPEEKILFTGDTLFCQGIGRTDLAGGSETLLLNSIREKLLCFPDETIIYPGHGDSSTIGQEKRNNPFLN